MLTISLDETGDFEKDEIMAVGGVIFHSKDPDKELDRIKSFFVGVCKNNDAEYPSALHHDLNGPLLAALPSFLKGTGEWKNNPPKGEYYLYYMVGDKNGISSYNNPSISNLLNDSQGANRYEHMAYRVIENVIFNNIRLKDYKYRLNLATRVFTANDESEYFNAQKNGHLLVPVSKKSEIHPFSSTAHSGYRAIISSALMNHKNNSLDIDLKVDKIDYKLKDSDPLKRDKAWKQGFFYLADTVCTAFRSLINDCRNSFQASKKLIERSEKFINPDHLFGWVYHEIDRVWINAVDEYEHGNLFEGLMLIDFAEKKYSELAEIYGKMWFPYYEQMIRSTNDITALEKAFDRLLNYLNSPDNEISFSLKVFRILKKALSHDPDNSDQYMRLNFFVHKAGLIIYNHLGKNKEAKAEYTEAVRYAQYASIEEYLELRNLMTVFLLDGGDYSSALDNTLLTENYEKELVSIKKKMYSENDRVFIHYGKTESQLAQCYSFLGMTEDAEKHFKMALRAFGDDKENRTRTLSYYLHLLIEKRDVHKYEQYAKEYFGSADLDKQLDAITKFPAATASYSFYVYSKALVWLYADTIDRCLVEKLTKTLLKITKRDPKGHPWELIFRYAAVLWNANCIDSAGTNCKMLFDYSISSTIENSKIINKINKETKIIMDNLEKGKDVLDGTKLNYMYR